ncbi:hypothetical protein KP509_34G051000 [Ceratopteris richardii]|nr:hypothetical protein KP509_34G051000 [Ceratopteris richardii]
MQKEVWETDQRSYELLIADQQDECRSIRNGIYQVIGMYIMFHSVIFTAVAQNNLLNCALSWCPVSLCAVVCLATLLTVAERFESAQELDMEVKESNLRLSSVIKCMDDLDKHGAELDLETKQPQVIFHSPGFAARINFLLSFNNLLVICILTGFTALVCWFYVRTLCENCKPCPA